jgi:hypothetical protein
VNKSQLLVCACLGVAIAFVVASIDYNNERAPTIKHGAAPSTGLSMVMPDRAWFRASAALRSEPMTAATPPAPGMSIGAHLAAVTDLADSTDRQAQSRLIEVALGSTEAVIRSEAAHALGERGEPGAVNTLQRMLKDIHPAVRRSALRALVDIGGSESALAVGAVLDSSDTALRLAAVDALGEIGGFDATQLLQRALLDEHGVIREAASQWLAEYSGVDQ